MLNFPNLREMWKHLAFLWSSGGVHEIYSQPQTLQYLIFFLQDPQLSHELCQNDWCWLKFKFVQFLQSWTFLGTPLYKSHQMILLFLTHYTCQQKQEFACGPVKMWVTASSGETQNPSPVTNYDTTSTRTTLRVQSHISEIQALQWYRQVHISLRPSSPQQRWLTSVQTSNSWGSPFFNLKSSCLAF